MDCHGRLRLAFLILIPHAGRGCSGNCRSYTELLLPSHISCITGDSEEKPLVPVHEMGQLMLRLVPGATERTGLKMWLKMNAFQGWLGALGSPGGEAPWTEEALFAFFQECWGL